MDRMDANKASGPETFTNNEKDQILSELRSMTRWIVRKGTADWLADADREGEKMEMKTRVIGGEVGASVVKN